MSQSHPPDLEATIRAACVAGEYGRAATLTVEGYGTDIMAFLLARCGSRGGVAEEVFGIFAEKLWVGLPRFEWRCSMRSWAYRLARNAANDYVSSAGNRPERNLPLSQNAPPSQVMDRVRTTTASYRRTAAKDRMRELRETLPADDQMLLILRIDRGLDFRELAEALNDSDAPLDSEGLEREAARLRKRFERVKEQLRELATERGLL
jgi:RNA polymerase sigma-70 factor (ECF subfamily)